MRPFFLTVLVFAFILCGSPSSGSLRQTNRRRHQSLKLRRLFGRRRSLKGVTSVGSMFKNMDRVIDFIQRAQTVAKFVPIILPFLLR